MAVAGLEYLSLQGNAVTGQIPSCLLAAGMLFLSMSLLLVQHCKMKTNVGPFLRHQFLTAMRLKQSYPGQKAISALP